MAVTRSQKRNSKKNVVVKTRKKRFQINVKDCVVKLERLTQEMIDCFTKVKPEKKYNLRVRLNKAETRKVVKKKTNTAVVRNSSQSVDALWAAAKNSRSEPPKEKEIVLVKMRTYSPWPAKIITISNKKVFVYFFGTANHGYVNVDEIVPFTSAPILIVKLSTMKIKDFTKAVREAEIMAGISSDRSILNF